MRLPVYTLSSSRVSFPASMHMLAPGEEFSPDDKPRILANPARLGQCICLPQKKLTHNRRSVSDVRGRDSGVGEGWLPTRRLSIAIPSRRPIPTTAQSESCAKRLVMTDRGSEASKDR